MCDGFRIKNQKDAEGNRFFMGKCRNYVYLLVLITCFCTTGCITTKQSLNDNNPFPKDKFNKGVVAVLPVKSQTSLSTESLSPLKNEINKILGVTLKEKLPGITIISSQRSSELLNDSDKLDLIDKLLVGYENSGIYDKKIAGQLTTILNADYLVIPKLKAEKQSMILASAFSSSLEVSFVAKSGGSPQWSGLGDMKRGGIFGAGNVSPVDAAQKLVELAFED